MRKAKTPGSRGTNANSPARKRARARASARGVDQVVVWTLRALLHAVKETESAAKVLARCDESMRLLGFDHLRLDEAKRPQALRRVERALEEATLRPPVREEPVYRNVERLGELLELKVVEREILALATKCVAESGLVEPFSMLTPRTRTRIMEALVATLHEFDFMTVREALDRTGALRSTGLVRWPEAQQWGHEPPLELLDDMAQVLTADYADDQALLAPFFRVAPGSDLTVADFPHLAADIELLCRFLGQTRKAGTTGVNILFHGQPGTGKTELARVLAVRLSQTLYEVAVGDRDGAPMESKQRLPAYLLCQRFASRIANGLILFDEAEDLFPADSYGPFAIRTRSANQKGFTNRMLEENHVPTIWITNAIGSIDRGVLRRFDFQLEFRIPPRSVRRTIAGRHTEALAVAPSFLDRLADCEEVTPADLKAAAKVATLAGGDGAPAPEATVERVVRHRLDARGGRLADVRGADGAIPYSVEYLNASRDPARLTEALQARPRGNVLLYGPPGTGKTAYVRHVAERLDRPLVVRRASDLLNPYVGVTERHIAEMFQRARGEEAVLLLDEADSFLRDRREAFHSWEVTQVNELLVGMEQFGGLFFCSTNLVDDLDQAAFRRFVMKVRFEYLKPEQAWAMFEVLCGESGCTPDDDLRVAVARIRILTPGDFATVRRQLLLEGETPTPDRLVALLDEECRMKRDGQGGVNGIGFRS